MDQENKVSEAQREVYQALDDHGRVSGRALRRAFTSRSGLQVFSYRRPRTYDAATDTYQCNDDDG